MLILLLSGGGALVNQPPVVDAGNDQSVYTGFDIAFDGTVTDDGLPSGTLTYLWTQQSGPGTISFIDATAVDTLGSANLAGVYVVRLTASDSLLSAFDELTITVTDAPAATPGSIWDSFWDIFWR